MSFEPKSYLETQYKAPIIFYNQAKCIQEKLCIQIILVYQDNE